MDCKNPQQHEAMDAETKLSDTAKTIIARFDRAKSLTEGGQFSEAESLYQLHLREWPDDYLAMHNLGVLYLKRGKHFGADWTAAFAMFERVTTEPHEDYQLKAASMNNFGDLMLKCGRSDKAAICFEKAYHWDSTNPAIRVNKAWSLMEELRFEEADKELAETIRLDPSSPKAKFNRGVCLLGLGALREGWKGFEHRFEMGDPQMIEFKTSKPKWNGSDFKGKTVMVTGEQGYGDSLMFIRYLKMVKARGGQVHWHGHAALNDLFRSVDGIDKIWEEPPPEGAYDFWLHLLSLPHVFKTGLHNIPDEVPYIKVKTGKIFVPNIPGVKVVVKTRVGLCWAGSPLHGKDRQRSFEPETFQPLIDAFPELEFFSLQVGPRAGEFAKLSRVTDLAPKMTSWLETAHWLNSLDLLISCDTSVVHLAGAMARPVWTLLPFCPDWRWMLERSDSPWYDSMRLFRQDERKNYSALVGEQIIPALKIWEELK